MRKRSRPLWETWGYALMCMLCAGVVLFSALWTRSARKEEAAVQPSAQSMDESLEEALSREASFVRPCQGEVLRPFDREWVYFSQTGVWRTHPGVDFLAPAGTEICAAGSGTVIEADDGRVVLETEGYVLTCLGLETLLCEKGQAVEQGASIGLAGAHVPFEGKGHVCILLQDVLGNALDLCEYLQ